MQSAYLKYILGEETDKSREAGDVGAADAFNYVPMKDAGTELAAQGITLRNGQNIPRGALKRLFKRAQQQTRATRKIAARAAQQAARNAAATAAGRSVRAARAAPTPPALRFAKLFFGSPNGRPNASRGFYAIRPDGRPKLLVLAIPKSRYVGPCLVPGWNRAVLKAMETLPSRMERLLAEAQARRSGGSSAASGGGSTP